MGITNKDILKTVAIDVPNMKSQLEDIESKDISTFSSLKEAISSKYNLFSSTQLTITINEKIDINTKKTINLENCTIKLDGGYFDIKAPCSIKNGIIDGLTKTDKAFVINSNNVDIIGVSIKNLYSQTYSYGITVNEGFSKINISNCLFDNISSVGNSITGDIVGADRGIITFTEEEVKISNCTFNNIGRCEEDGDCIVIATEQENGYYKYAKVVIDNCYFNNIKKRGIKLFASGVVCSNNVLKSTEVEFGNSSAIAIYGNDCKIINNVIDLERSNSCLWIENCKDIYISNNTMINNKSNLYTTVGVSTILGINIINSSNIKILNNSVSSFITGVYAGKSIKLTSSSSANENIIISNNTVFGDIETNNSNYINISNNMFPLSIGSIKSYNGIQIKTSNYVVISNNVINTDSYPVRLHSGDKMKITYNSLVKLSVQNNITGGDIVIV